MITLGDLIAAREAELEALREAARRNEELVAEMEAMNLRHAGEIAEVRRDWWKGKEGVYLIREDGFTRCSEGVEWTPPQLYAWMLFAPSVEVVADLLAEAFHVGGFVPADLAREVLAAIVNAINDADQLANLPKPGSERDAETWTDPGAGP